MGWQRLREAIPTLVIHMAVAAVHMTLIVFLNGGLSPVFGAFVAGLLVAAPLLGVAATLADFHRLGSGLFLLSFVGTAGLILTAYLGQGLLLEVLQADSSPGKILFFASAMALPLLQIKGISETVQALLSGRRRLIHLASK